jgi:hypothetical protein
MTHFRVNVPSVIHEIIDGEAVLINLESGSYFSIDNVGALVWEYVEKGLSGTQIVEAVAAQFEGDRAEIAAGIQRLFDTLQAEQLIVPRDGASGTGDVPLENRVGDGVAKRPYEAPVLHKYTDMEDLLLLDPIHDVDESGWPNTSPKKA